MSMLFSIYTCTRRVCNRINNSCKLSLHEEIDDYNKQSDVIDSAIIQSAKVFWARPFLRMQFLGSWIIVLKAGHINQPTGSDVFLGRQQMQANLICYVMVSRLETLHCLQHIGNAILKDSNSFRTDFLYPLASGFFVY